MAHMKRIPSGLLRGYLLIAGVLALGTSCFQAPPAPPPVGATQVPATATPMANSTAAAPKSANEILKRLLDTYRAAKSYQDQGIVKLEFSQAGTRKGDQWPCAVAFVRPNKLSLVAFQATVKSDGRELVAKIDDPPTNNFDGQVLVRPAPQELKLTDLASDERLYDIIASQLRRQPIQLELLLESGGLAAAFGADVACQQLPDGQIDGRDCYCVEVPSPGGPFVFWVDRADFLLRRLDYPVASLLPDLAADPSVADLRISAELLGAKIDGIISDDQFTLAIPADAKRMKSLVVPPWPLPSQLFGREPSDFHFTKLDGQQVTANDLTGRVAVLAWYHGDPACEATMQQVSAAAAKLKDDDAVRFLAVATDPTTVGNDQLQNMLTGWKVELPIVRDLDALGKSAFQIESHPTIVVLDEQGRVQIFQVGGNPELGEQLVQIAERLKSGGDFAAEILAGHQRERKAYDELVARGGPEPGQVLELPEAVIRQRSEPREIKLRELWTCRELKSPGNFVLVDDAGQPPRVFVIEGLRTVTEIGPEGKVVSRHTLDLPPQTGITYVRTAVGKDGQRLFAAAAPLAAQVHLFDERWQLTGSLPAADQSPLALVDLALADVNDGDGTVEVLTANVDDIGLVALDTDGQTVWRNATFPNVFSIAVTPPNDVGSWGMLVTGEAGSILRVNRFGREEPPVKIGQWQIARLLPARFAGAKQAAMLGLAADPQGRPVAVGITSDLNEAWNYPLPVGAHQRPIEPIAAGNLLAGHAGEWWLAGPDGSIHVITEDGELFDHFNYGAALTGLAAAKIGEESVLLVATDDGVTAWKVSLEKTRMRQER
jgi:hypothetical protein